MPAAAATGPFRLGARIGLCLFPLLTFGFLGTVPSLVLALRRRGRWDFVWAAVFLLLQLIQYVCFGLTPKSGASPTVGLVGGSVSTALWLIAPAHFLLMARPSLWPAAPAPVPYVPAPPPYPPADELQQLGELLRRQAHGDGR